MSGFYFGSNNCQFLLNLKESYLTNITYFQVTGLPLQAGDYCYGSRWCN